MTKTIATYDDLLQEKERLKLLLKAQKEVVRQDIQEIKAELAPVKTAISMVGKFATKDRSNWLITAVADKAIDILLKKLVLSKAGWITKLVVPHFMKNFSSHVIADNKDKILGKLFSLFGKKDANGVAPSEPVEEEEED